MNSPVTPRLDRAASEGLAAAGKGIARPRSYGIHNRAPAKLSAACEKGLHSSCFSLHCTCKKCWHGSLP